MKAVIFTKNQDEFLLLKSISEKAASFSEIRHETDDEKFRMNEEVGYDVSVIALNGAEGMEVIRDNSVRYPKSKLIWITEDKYFAGVAIRSHICDFITRPFSNTRFYEAIKKAVMLQ